MKNSVSDLDPDSIQVSGSGFMRPKKIHKNRKSQEISCFDVQDVLFWTGGFSCSLDVRYGGLGISKL
jgi:hypothetical protein